jgi:hypothetical protein
VLIGESRTTIFLSPAASLAAMHSRLLAQRRRENAMRTLIDSHETDFIREVAKKVAFGA